MVKYYYTVIVGTRPGVYTDWYLLAGWFNLYYGQANIYFRSQAAPNVIEVSGAIHKKYKSSREAWEAYHTAAREGRVRAVEVDTQPVDFGAFASTSAATFLSVAPDNDRKRDSHPSARYPQTPPPACEAGCSSTQPATLPVSWSSLPKYTAEFGRYHTAGSQRT